jgi:hypothetical protein
MIILNSDDLYKLELKDLIEKIKKYDFDKKKSKENSN